MYLETRYGWYILEMPSKAYQAYFEDFWTKNKITHLLLSESLENPKLDKEQFLDMLDKRDEFSASVLKDRLEDDNVVNLDS
jgi:DNA (cytosine-5)-methyltransferase 1